MFYSQFDVSAAVHCVVMFHRMMQKQLAYMLGRQQIFLDVEDDVPDFDDLAEIMSNSHLNNNFLALAREVMVLLFVICYFYDKTLFCFLTRFCCILSACKVSMVKLYDCVVLQCMKLDLIESKLCFRWQLDIMEPKVPEDIYKSHLEPNSKCCH